MEQFQTFIPLLILVVVFWLLILRPMRKRQRVATETQQAIRVGAEVMLASGIFGTVASIDEDKIGITIAPSTNIAVHRQAIGRVIEPDVPAESPADLDTE